MALYQERWQVGSGRPSEYEGKLADALEAAFAAGHHALGDLIAALNRSGPRPPDGAMWSAESFQAEMKRLGA